MPPLETIYLTTTPNQRNFVKSLASVESARIYICDSYTINDYIDLGKSLPSTVREVFIPFYGSVDGVYCVMELRKRNLTVALKKFYESLLSYHVHPWFEHMYLENKDFQHSKEDSLDEFIGIKEFDKLFNRQPCHFSKTFSSIYPINTKVPTALQNAKRIFVGQPLPEDGSMSLAAYKKVLETLVTTHNIDLYIRHPREAYEPDTISSLRLDSPLECYRDALADKTFFMIFSTAGIMIAEQFGNVNYIELSENDLSISPWAWKSYKWMLERYPKIKLNV